MATQPKPDPSLGVFETMLVVRGAPVAFEAHLSRLERSQRELYGMELPEEARQLAAERAAGLELGRLRLTLAPSVLEAEASELDRSLHFPERPVSLRSHSVDGGLGSHKWVDRAAIPPSQPGEAALLFDGEEVLEAAWANVFAIRRGALFTPPLDGRILPGVTRATVIELARAADVEVVEGILILEELQSAEGVFLTNSLRGIEAVGSIDGVPLQNESPLIHSLKKTLRRRWGEPGKRNDRPEAVVSPN
jgi:branched-subunit amino acid aminotransferase/4-amino-4-deoxychorismate lyase